MSLRHLNIAPRASLGFAFIALLVVVLGVFAVNRMTLIREASVAMSANLLPSVTYLGTITENVLRLRILSFRVLVNREPAALQEAENPHRCVGRQGQDRPGRLRHAARRAGRGGFV